ncbi:hypothetical protein V4C53_21390 [Paraburkholderia azotifigens]|uniref:hypothetical protein n=1 Tax=Paraburkholderia azotifigens TaxID=2057004 RepID=UPI003180785F
MTDQQHTVLGEGAAMLTPSGYQVRPKIALGSCNKTVPPAAPSIIGKCPYYYQPLHGEYLETVEKVSVSSAWETVKAFATSWDPWKDKEVARRLLHRREQLIAPESTDSDWSRHGSFMMRHIGCGHKPPSYYVSYGYYYCSSYGAKLYPKLSPPGQAWLRNARKLLQTNMEDGLRQNMIGDQIQISSVKPGNGSFSLSVPQYELELDDDTFKSFAFKTHPMAYLDGGLADLPISDLLRITAQPNIQEWGDARTWEQAVDSGQVVLPNMINQSDIDDPVGKALGRLLAK